jgi:transcriptional regulator with XRE-family HTH domain
MSSAQHVHQPDPEAVIAKATLRAAERLELNQSALAEVIGVSPASISRLAQGQSVDLRGKGRECALFLVRIFRSLDALMGGDSTKASAWFHAHNRHLHGVPAELVKSIGGLTRVAEYLDAMRGTH